jgi:maltose O-acetyltransferase
MLRGELDIADDEENSAEFGPVQELLARFNSAAPGAWDERDALLREMLRDIGEGVVVRPPFFCEYGNIRIGRGGRSGRPCSHPARDRRPRPR